MPSDVKQHKKIIDAWCMYDWANSAFATTILAAVFPIYYATSAGANLPGNLATAYWGFTASGALLMVAICAPVLGAIADHFGAKKKFLLVFVSLGIAATALMATVGRGDWATASAFYVLGYVGFAGGMIFYESLLPHICRPDEMDSVSSKGYALGYLGGGLLLAVNLAWILKPKLFGMANAEIASRISFLSVGVWWGIFSIPLFRRIAEPETAPGPTTMNPVRAGFQRLSHTFKDIRRYKELMKFLIAFWLYSDGIGTIIKMSAIYGTEIGIDRSALIGALVVVQFAGIPCTLAFGYVARPLGVKRAIFLALAIYCFVAVFGYFMTQAWHFWALAVMVATAQGGAQALSRSLFGRMVPKSKSAEFFGFYSVSSKFAGIFGPLLFALISQHTGNSRISIVSLIFFFVAGGALLSRVNIEDGIRAATEED